MIIVNTDYISGKEIETIQLVKGSIVFSKNVVRASDRPHDKRSDDARCRRNRQRPLFHKQSHGKRRRNHRLRYSSAL